MESVLEPVVLRTRPLIHRLPQGFIMTLTSITDLVRSVRSRSPRWMRNPQVVFRLRMRQRLAHRSEWAGAWDA